MKKTFLVLTGLALFAFNTYSQTSLTDVRDGNVYLTVTIGTQVWMAENLRFLPSVVEPTTGSQSTPYNYVYDYKGTDVTAAKATSNYTTFGVLYNWPAAMASSAGSTANPSGVQGVCPAGWHLPSDAEWTQLISYLGGENYAGNKLKETGNAHWAQFNSGATNETGFTALPGGFRHNNGTFGNIGYDCYLWSATEFNANNAWCRVMYGEDGKVYKSSNYKDRGISVRCVSDIVTNIPKYNENQNIQIYPNPTTDRVNINITEMRNAKMKIYDIVGTCLLAGDLENGANNIDLRKLTKGIYLIHVIANSHSYQVKLNKE